MVKLSVEIAVEADRDAACALARQAHEETIFSDIPFSAKKFDRSMNSTLEEPNKYLGLKVSMGDRILGFCFAMMGGYYVGEDSKVITVIAIVTDKNIRSSMLGGKAALRLVRGVEVWGRKQGAQIIMYHVTSGHDIAGIDSFFRKSGMTTLGGNYGIKIK